MKVSKVAKTTQKRLKVQGILLVIAAAIACGSIYGSVYFQDEVETKSAVEGTYNQLKADIQAQQAVSEDLGSQIDATGKSLSGSFMSKDEFIAFMGSTSQRLGLALNKYTGGDTVEKDGITTMNFKLEVEGDLTQLEDLVKSIDLLGTPYAINSISARKADNYIWLDRDINKMEILPWWNGKSLEVKKPYTEVEEPEPIGIIDIMGSQNLKMYLDVSFISSKEQPDKDSAGGEDAGTPGMSVVAPSGDSSGESSMTEGQSSADESVASDNLEGSEPEGTPQAGTDISSGAEGQSSIAE